MPMTPAPYWAPPTQLRGRKSPSEAESVRRAWAEGRGAPGPHCSPGPSLMLHSTPWMLTLPTHVLQTQKAHLPWEAFHCPITEAPACQFCLLMQPCR